MNNLGNKPRLLHFPAPPKIKKREKNISLESAESHAT